MDALVPQFSSLTIEQITEAFAKQVVSTAKINITAVIRENLAMWESKLFPVIGAYEISMYEVLADILIEAGCRAVPESEADRAMFVRSVGNKVRSVRAERGELTATQKRKAQRSALSTKATPLPALGVSSPVVMKAVEAPAAVARVQAVQGANGAGLVSEPMAVPKTAVSVPAAAGGFSFKAAFERLKAESADSPWSAEDDELHQAFLTMCSERNAGSIKNLTHYLKPNENSKRDCFVQFLAKVDRTKKAI